MKNDSIKLANLWTELNTVKDKIDNEIIPIGGYLGIDDPDLMIALEQLSDKIKNHFEGFKLTAVPKRQP
jgi:hypothetical protein